MMQDTLASPAPQTSMATEETARQHLSATNQPALTSREVELMRGLAAGLTNQQIARTLHRSEKTIRNQLTRLYEKLGARNRTEAVAIHLRRGNG
jgi:DNA-binding NarL/FixJ family response regulator